MRNRGLNPSLLLLFALSFSSMLLAQNNGVDENSQAERPTRSVNTEQPLQRMDVKTFTGKITRHGKDYVLYDMATNLTFKLDNQAEARKYFGKEVSVVGQLIAPGNALHVTKIVRAR